MCFQTQCSKCGLVTYKGCGKHAKEVLATVSTKNLCRCGKLKYLIKGRKRIRKTKKK